MPKPLSEQLAELSVRAKHAEDALAGAKKEAHDKVVARKEQARATAQGKRTERGGCTVRSEVPATGSTRSLRVGDDYRSCSATAFTGQARTYQT
jgi:hypothetical protein